MAASLCKASIKSGNRCGNECEPGWTFCEEHRDRPKAIKEREEKAISDAVEATSIATSVLAVPEEAKTASEPQTVQIPAENTTIQTRREAQGPSVFDKVLAVLDKTQDFSDDAYKMYYARLELAKAGDPDGLRYTDKAGAEQIRSEWSVYERSLDREIRAATAVAKLNIENQALNMNKMLKDLIGSVVRRVFERMELNPEEIDRARQYLSEEFAKQTKN